MVFFYSKDGLHYIAGGYLFGKKRLFDDCQEWSGSTLLREVKFPTEKTGIFNCIGYLNNSID